ncbi:MAG TPA: hypothetical protein VE028_00225 [Nitratidesulfovibrio sp.]|nr:hypothetical protein [Nitratidesulfovibrio sp.]
MQYRAKIETFANGRTVQPGEIVNLPFDPEWPEAWEAMDTGHEGAIGIGILEAEGQKTEAETHERVDAASKGEASASPSEADAASKGEPAKAEDGSQASGMDAPAPSPGTAETGGKGLADASEGKTEAPAPTGGGARGRAPKPRNT